MPIVDGLTATKMIRSYEKTHKQSNLSPRARINGRVPIFAVSASLVERERQTYVDAGFDGWILKPVDFRRLNELLCGIVDDKLRISCLYAPGQWERGGWFESRQPDVFQANTAPSKSQNVVGAVQDNSSGTGTSISSGSEESNTTVTPYDERERERESRKPLIHDERLDNIEQIAGQRVLKKNDRTSEDGLDESDS